MTSENDPREKINLLIKIKKNLGSIDFQDNIPTEIDEPIPFETAVVENETFGVSEYSNLAFYDQVRRSERKQEEAGYSFNALSHSEFESFFDIVNFIGKDNFKIAEAPVVMYNGQTIEIMTLKFKELSDIDRYLSEQVAGHRTIYLLAIQKFNSAVIVGAWDGNFKPIDPADQVETKPEYEFKLRLASVY